MSRTLLVPPYLETQPAWTALMAAIDEVFSDIDVAIQDMDLLRKPLNTSDRIFASDLESGKLTRFQDVPTLERVLAIKLCSQLGFSFRTSGVMAAEDYIRVASSIGQYYATTKGTEGWHNFFAFCLNAVFDVKKLWTTDYVTFVEEGSEGIPVWDGGAWYPTTHVRLTYQTDKFEGISEATIRTFFYFFANINLVLESITIDTKFTLPTEFMVSGHVETWI